MPALSVVVPVFNENPSIPVLAERLDDALGRLGLDYEIILVDDGSTDGSWDAMLAAARRFSCFRLIRLRRNFGQTAALSAGFNAARGEVIVTLDADLQNDPADIPRLLEQIGNGADVVSGWRRRRRDPFWTRRLPSMIANALISKITGVALHDYGCTLKAYRREVLAHLRLYGELHRFIPALATWAGGRIVEVEVSHEPRRFGVSKYGLSRTFRVLLDLVTVSFLLRYSTRPLQIFGKIGLIFGVPGLIMMLLVVGGNLSYMLFGTKFASDLVKRPAWIITPFMLVLFALQFIVMGLVAELVVRTYHESQNRPTYVIRETFG